MVCVAVIISQCQFSYQVQVLFTTLLSKYHYLSSDELMIDLSLSLV